MALANVREKTAPNISEGKIRIHVTEPKVYDRLVNSHPSSDT